MPDLPDRDREVLAEYRRTIPARESDVSADPWPSELVAGDRTEPRPGSRRAKVLARLLDTPGVWVLGHELAAPEVGGSEGLRRVRELREGGWPIERRPASRGLSTSWEYRLAVEP
jgi:hypothetical protein